MPIISKVGTKGARVRLVYGLMYLALTLGAVSMVYPFLLMLAGSTASEADFGRQKPWPEFWSSDTMLFRKYVESKYNVDSALLESAWQTPSPGWHRLEPEQVQRFSGSTVQWLAKHETRNAQLETVLAEFCEWRAAEGRRWGLLGHTRGARLQPANMRLFREDTMRRFNGDLAACSRVSGLPMQSWNAVVPPREDVGRTWGRTFRSDEADWQAFKRSRPVENLVIPNLDGLFWRQFIVPRYTADINAYNRAHGTSFASPDEITLPPRVPDDTGKSGGAVLAPPETPGGCQRHGLLLNPGVAEAAGASGVAETSSPVPPATSATPRIENNPVAVPLSRGVRGDERTSSPRLPDAGLAAREWEEFVRRKLPLEFIRLDAEAAPAWRAALRTRYAEIAKLNAAHGTSFAGFDEIPLPRSAPDRGPVRADWELFIQDAACPVARLEVYGPRQAFEEYLAAKSGKAGDGVPPSPAPPAECQRHGLLSTPGMAEAAGASGVAETSRPFSPAASAIPVLKETRGCATLQRGAGRGENALAPISLPFGRLLAAADWADMQARRGALKWEFTTRNFRHVAGYILLHGNGVRNTVIYCILAVLTALVVNPLAAYALSRFRLPATYQILLFCMATMTFPGEVTMIPSFLLLRRFPLWPLLAGLAAAMAVFLLLRRGRPTWTDGARLLTALCAGSLTGGLLVPLLMPSPNVSLLNSFAALVLPGMANGFFIFLLKGFFDSLPQELYESAEIDGASEWHKFWHITMTLSKPILAVVALNAFTVAYSAFMFALIIVPDPEMWTMMVWIYQLGTQSHQAVVYASLVLAAIPTFIILAFCQNIIMRGLVVPTEK